MLPPYVHPPRAVRARRSGFSLVEIVLVLAILSVASAMYAQTVASSRRLDPIAQETAIAAEAARIALERLRAVPPERLLATFDDDPGNDPDGAGTAPGARFAVEGLAPSAAGVPVGRYVFPLVEGRLAEDYVDALLGLPRDLNGDGLVDSGDHRADWVILPIEVRLEWSPRGSMSATRDFSLYTMIPRL
ncbi:MAG: type II secretion system protein [Planctomycetes bacterium]|nr:type II secretion system protein [Planctomycetota bacterium]